jgi:sugar phosphate isomerase/epimerase
MEITLGCSLADWRANPDYQRFSAINIENPLYPGYLDGDCTDDLEHLQRECRQRLVIDGPYIDLNPGSPEPAARRLAQEKILAAIAYAQQGRAEEIVFLSTFLPFIGLESYEHGWVEESVRSWKAILEKAGDLRISLCNTFEYDPTYLIEIAAALDDARFGLAFDVGHCLVWGKLDPLEWYRRVRDRCRVVYLHSNDGRTDRHESIRSRTLATGDLLAGLGRELREDSIVVLKYFAKATVSEDIDYLHALWE